MRVPDLQVAHRGEGAHRGPVLADGVEHHPVLVPRAVVVVASSDQHARRQALDVPLPGARERLVEVVDVEHELALGRREHAEVRQVSVAAALHVQPRARRSREVVGHDLGRATVEGERGHEHPAVADRHELGDARARLVLEQSDRVGAICVRLVLGVAGSWDLGAGRLAPRDAFFDGQVSDDLRSGCRPSCCHFVIVTAAVRAGHHPMGMRRRGASPSSVRGDDSAPGARESAPMSTETTYGETPAWEPQVPRFRLVHVVLSWLVAAVAVLIAAAIVPGVSVGSFVDALAAAAGIAALNAVLPPLVAALRLPFTLALGFVTVLALDAVILLIVPHITGRRIVVDSFGAALLAALVIAAATIALDVILGVDDDDAYSLRVIKRIARRQGNAVQSDAPGIVFLEIDGLALPVLRRAMRDGATPQLTSWLESGAYRLDEWEPDLSSQTGASQAGILLGGNEDIPAFRWVEKGTGRVMTCSSPQDCAEIERRLANGRGLLIDAGASRGNLFSGDAEAMILTVSRMAAEKRANPGYRAFLANGFNVSRLLVLFCWEAVLEKGGGHPPAPARHPAARKPRRTLSPDASGVVRRGAGSDRVRRSDRHDAGPSGCVRHVLGLRRGRAPLGARTAGHTRGAAQDRSAVRSHRSCPALCPPALRDRGAVRPRSDAGRDVQAAQRL